MSAPTHSTSAAKREVLHGLAQAVAVLAKRIQGQGEAAHAVGLLTARAEALAARAWEIACASRNDKEAAANLAAAINDFIEHATALSKRVAREASTSNAFATMQRDEAIELQSAGRELDGINDMNVIRARLRPLLDRLTAIPGRLAAMTEVASEVAELGDMAEGLAKRTQGLQESGRTAGVAAVALYKELRGFANASGSVASKMWEDEREMQQTIAQLRADPPTRLARDGSHHDPGQHLGGRSHSQHDYADQVDGVACVHVGTAKAAPRNRLRLYSATTTVGSAATTFFG